MKLNTFWTLVQFFGCLALLVAFAGWSAMGWYLLCSVGLTIGCHILQYLSRS